MYTRILFVNHDRDVLQSLQKQLSPLRTKWEMSFVQNGKEAIDRLAEEPFSIVMTDLQMPVMDGAQLLNTVMKQYPSTLRFILSTQTDTAVAAHASIPAHQYLSLPCSLETLENTVERALALRNRLSDEKLKTLVAQIRTLPSLPDLYLHVMQELRSPDFSLNAIGKIIAQDIGMCAKVLKLVNSAYFALPQRVSSPALAVNLLGIDTIKSMILLFETFEQFDRMRALAPQFDLRGLQQHSMVVGNYARTIAGAEQIDAATGDAFFMAGLFHDIGKLTLIANMPQKYNEAFELCKDNNMTMTAAEQIVFGATHADVGAYLLGLWGFSDTIVEACACHHDPNPDENSLVNTTSVVYIANIFAQSQEGDNTPPTSDILFLEYLVRTGLTNHVDRWLPLCRKFDKNWFE